LDIVATGFQGGQYGIYLVEIGGTPAFTFRNSGNIYYVRSTSVKGVAWNAPVMVRSGATQNVQMVSVGGLPAIASYINATTVGYDIASDVDGTSWTSVNITTGATFNTEYNYGIGVVEGNPVIVVGDSGVSTLYIRSSTADGKMVADWSSTIILPGMEGGSQISLINVNGNPAVAAATDGPGAAHIAYTRATNTTGALLSDWPSAVTVVPNNAAWVPSSVLAFDAATIQVGTETRPCVLFFNNGGTMPDGVYFLIADDANGTSWDVDTNAVQVTAQANNVKMFSMPDGRVLISYVDDFTLGDQVMLVMDGNNPTDISQTHIIDQARAHRSDSIGLLLFSDNSYGTCFCLSASPRDVFYVPSPADNPLFVDNVNISYIATGEIST
jgi:hypothetical protein